MATNKVQTGLRLDEAAYEKAKAVAERERRSLNNFIEYAVQQYIERYEDEHGAIQTQQEG